MGTHETFLRVKAVERADGRWIEGFATTGRQDLVGDIVWPEGAQFTLPLPLLFAHSHSDPLGAVTEASVTRSGIRIRAKLTAGVVRAEEVWRLILDGALTACSIGFSGLKSTPIAGGGLRFDEWLWHELSIVAVGANPDARISIAKCKAYATPQAKQLPPIKSEGPPLNIDAERFGRAVGEQILATVAPLKQRIVELEKTVAGQQVKQERAMIFSGEFQQASDYPKGAAVTAGGKLFVATRFIPSGKAPPARDGSGWARLTT